MQIISRREPMSKFQKAGIILSSLAGTLLAEDSGEGCAAFGCFLL